MKKKVIKYVALTVLVYLLICLVTPFNKYLKNRSIKNQISYIDKIMRNGYDDELQSRFPEGKLFSNALFSLSIIEFCEANNCNEEKYANIVDNNIERILSNTALQAFDPNMQPKFGMFYNGWSLYVLKKYQKSRLFESSRMKQQVIDESFVFEQRMLEEQKDDIQILNSYAGVNWPADNLIGLIALDNDTLQNKWLSKIFTTAQHESGLIHHIGSQKSMIRGSSQALITFCLNEIAYEQIQEYNNTFTKTFIDNYLGVQLVKENEDGSSFMDVDSGPVIFGYGASATIMNIKTQASMNNNSSKKTWAIMNCISFPINIFGKKYYLFKQEPMFDIFMLWGSVELN